MLSIGSHLQANIDLDNGLVLIKNKSMAEPVVIITKINESSIDIQESFIFVIITPAMWFHWSTMHLCVYAPRYIRIQADRRSHATIHAPVSCTVSDEIQFIPGGDIYMPFIVLFWFGTGRFALMSFRVYSYDCPRAIEVILKNIGKKLYYYANNSSKTKHN